MQDAAGPLVDLIGHTYDAALGRRSWAFLLEAIADALNSRQTHILVHDRQRGAGLVGAVRSDPDMQRQYLEHYAAVNPYPHHPAAPRGVGLVYSGDWLPRSEVARTEFYNEFLRRSDAFPVLVGSLFGDGRRTGHLASYRPFHGEPHGRRETELLAALLPHLQRAIQISGLMELLETERSCWLASLDLLSHGMVVLDGRGAPSFVNRAARRLLTPEDGLAVTRTGLRASHPADSLALATLVAAALRTASGQGLGASGCLALRRPSGRRPLAVMVAPLPHRSAAQLTLEDSFRAPAALVFVADPEAPGGPEASSSLLASLFELTPRETEVAVRLAEGLTVGEIATRLSISFHTARVHQRRIYDKMGVHTQSELLHVVRTLTPPVEPASEPSHGD